MIKSIAFLSALILFGNGPLMAADGVNFLISIHQKEPSADLKVLLYSDSAVVAKGVSASGFLTGFSLELEITSLDTSAVEFNVHIITLGSAGNTKAKRFRIEYGLPAIIHDIEVKKDAYYSLTLVPQARVEIPERECPYNHNAGTDFTLFPSANFDLHYLKSSLASYHTAALKNLFEGEYRLFRSLFHFNLTSKQSLFLFPCEAHSVIWDKRFGTAFDPVRNNCYALYATGINTSDPFVLIHGAVLRSFGYAPPFLSEGLANYLSLALHTMKKIKNSGRLIPLNELVQTKTYLTSDPTVTDGSAATFVRYLIDQYSAGLFMELYAASDDLNLGSRIETTYAKPLEVLEKEWQYYVDTMKIPGQVYSGFADRAEQMWNYPQALEYRRAALELTTAHADSIQKLEQLAATFFLNGDYYNAAGMQERLVQIDTANTENLITLAGYRMMNGDFEKAFSDLTAARTMDSADEVLKFNLGFNYQYRGDSTKAAQIWNELIHTNLSGQLPGESRTMLGLLRRLSTNSDDKLQARDYFTTAIAIFNQQMQMDPALPNPYLWTGIALVGLGDQDNAYDQLNQALFLENRPFYVGMINLWLGKAADLRNNRELARSHFSEVMAVPSAVYHQDEARKYLDRPYKQ